MTPLPREVRLALCQVPGRRSRLHVAPVEERVDDDRDSLAVRAVDEREEVHERAVNAAVRKQAEQVQAPALLLGVANDRRDDGVLRERAVVHGVVDARDVHHRDAARAEIEVADLAVAHLPGGEPDVRPARADEAVRVASVERVEARRLGEPNGVVGSLGALAEAVEDDEHERARRCFGHATAFRGDSAISLMPREHSAVILPGSCRGPRRSSVDRRCSLARSRTVRSRPWGDGSRFATSLPTPEPIERASPTCRSRSDARLFPDDACVPGEPVSSREANAKPRPGVERGAPRIEAAQWVAYTDGACSGNPGPAGSGMVVIAPDGKIHEGFEYLGVSSTNNVAELTAILRALEAIPKDAESVAIHTDSKYAIGVLTQGWKAKANQELIAKTRAVLAARSNVRLVYVPGHSGVPMNERADELAREAIRVGASKPLKAPP